MAELVGAEQARLDAGVRSAVQADTSSTIRL